MIFLKIRFGRTILRHRTESRYTCVGKQIVWSTDRKQPQHMYIWFTCCLICSFIKCHHFLLFSVGLLVCTKEGIELNDPYSRKWSAFVAVSSFLELFWRLQITFISTTYTQGHIFRDSLPMIETFQTVVSYTLPMHWIQQRQLFGDFQILNHFTSKYR